MTDSAAPPEGGSCLLRLSGEIDISRVEEVLETATRRLDETPGTLEIDLSAVTFIDSSGLGALVHIRNEATRLDRSVALVDPPSSVARVLTVSGLDQVFEIRGGR